MQLENIDVLKEKQAEGKLLLLDFWATWCQPCKMLMPTIDRFAEGHPELEFIKIDVERHPELAQQMKVRGVPTVMLMRGEELLGLFSGVKNDMQLNSWFEAVSET
jgi:thioredoxin